MARKAVHIVDAAKSLDLFFGDFGKAVVEGSPMACALIATSVVENSLMTLLTTFFVEGSTTEKMFGSRGLLGDFFKCTQIAYCIGLIPKRVKQNLKKIAEIRNAFAHSRTLIDFQDANIVSLCSELTLPKGTKPTTVAYVSDKYPPSRLRFTLVCGLLGQHLVAYAALYANPLAVHRGQLKRPVAAEW